jgi:hypothetical protein
VVPQVSFGNNTQEGNEQVVGRGVLALGIAQEKRRTMNGTVREGCSQSKQTLSSRGTSSHKGERKRKNENKQEENRPEQPAEWWNHHPTYREDVKQHLLSMKRVPYTKLHTKKRREAVCLAQGILKVCWEALNYLGLSPKSTCFEKNGFF